MKNINWIPFLKKKIILIFCIGVLASIGLTGVKYLLSDVATRHGDYLFIQTIQVKTEIKEKDDFNYKGFLESPANYFQFMRIAENGDFDFSKVDSAWKQKSQYEQMDWVRKKIQVFSYNDNIIEVTAHFDANATQDVDYMRTHGKLLVDDFVNQCEQSIAKVKPGTTFNIVGREESFPVVEPINRKNMLIKFAIIGFIVGAIGSAFLFFLWGIRKQQLKK